MTIIRTKIIDLLDTHKISYRLLQHSEPVFTVEEAAAQRGVSKDEMVKSILLRDKDEALCHGVRPRLRTRQSEGSAYLRSPNVETVLEKFSLQRRRFCR